MREDDTALTGQITALNERLSEFLQQNQAGSQDPTTARLQRLEDRIDKIRDEHAETRRQASILEERIKHLPTKPDLWRALAALFAGMSGIIVFAEKLQGFVK